MVMSRLAVATLLALLLPAVTAQGAPKPEKVYWQVNATVAARFAQQLGFIPVAGIRPRGWFTVKVGKRTYKAQWSNTVENAPTAAVAAGTFAFDPDAGLFLDRPLTAAEQKRADVLADVARDADVLVLNRANPACGGLTYAQAKSLAAGEITDWSQVGSDAGPVTLHLTGEGFPNGLFGVEKLPPGAVLSSSGGLGATTRDRSSASVVPFSSVRDLPAEAACIVPLDGIAPSEDTVRSLAYPGAFPVRFVMSKKRSRRALDRLMVKRYVAFLRSERARSAFAATGAVLP
jgi:phosphate transport system substrate-binding protein